MTSTQRNWTSIVNYITTGCVSVIAILNVVIPIFTDQQNTFTRCMMDCKSTCNFSNSSN